MFVDGVDNDSVELFVSSSGVSSTEPVSPTIAALSASGGNEPTNVGSVSLRQYSSSQDIVVDGIRVADSWSQSPLPVELTSFTATVVEGGVVLNWTTATEVNNYGFEVEAEVAGNWTNIGFVEGHGNSNSPKDYSFFTSSNATSFRLKQVDTDGGFEYSDVVTVRGVLAKTELLQNHPNPFNPSTQISFVLANAGLVNVSVYNALGQKVSELINRNMTAGTHEVEFNASNLASGFYFYRLESAGFAQTMKMLLIK